MQCYLCKRHTVFFLLKNGFTIVKCPHCGLAQTVLDTEYTVFVKQHYNKSYFTGDKFRSAYIDYKDDKHYIVKNMQTFLNQIQRQKPTGKLLDVGCALGFFVELALSRGYDAHGIDPSSYAIDEAKKLEGDRFSCCTLDELRTKGESYDIITMFDVFEHLGDPKKDLEKAYKLLKKDGILVIATGDARSIMAKLLKRRWTFYIPPQHLFFFDKSTMTTILNDTGFTPHKWFRIGKWLSLRYVLHLAQTTGESKFAHLVDRIVHAMGLEKLPLYLPLQDNMVVISRKTV